MASCLGVILHHAIKTQSASGLTWERAYRICRLWVIKQIESQICDYGAYPREFFKSFPYLHTICTQAMKAQTILSRCPGLFEHLLINYVISTKISGVNPGHFLPFSRVRILAPFPIGNSHLFAQYHICLFQLRKVKMKKVNKQCLLDTPRTVRVSEKTWQVIVQTRRP